MSGSVTLEEMEAAARVCAADAYEYWRESLAGNNPPIHENEPHCGYFKIRDRRGLNAKLAPAKRKFIACAIWLERGHFKAEIAGTEVSMDRAWPWFARHPVSFEEYQYWHKHERWPNKGELSS